MNGHMSAFTNFILSSFRIPLSFQTVSSSMVAFLALPILALVSSEQLPVLVLMVPRYLKEFTLTIVYPSMSIDTFALSYPTTISLVFRAFNFSSLILPVSFTLCTLLFISCGDLPHSAVSSAYRKFEINLPPITAPDSVISASLITCSV